MGKSQAKGATLKYKDTTWKTVNNSGDFDFPLPPADEIDVTTHDSPGNQEEIMPGILKSSKIAIPLTWDDNDTSHTFLLGKQGQVQGFQYFGAGYPTSGSGYAFNAIVNIVFSNKVKDAKRATLNLTICGGTAPT
jgi:hypothetical protein